MSEQIEPKTMFACPQCGQPINPPSDIMQNLLICPACGHQFFIDIAPQEEQDDEAVREALQQELDQARELDGLRIRALSTERRAMYRTRSFLILGVAGCAIAIYEMAERLLGGAFNRLGQISMAMLMIGCGMGMVFFGRKTIALQKEIRQPRLTEPDQPPDFEPLGDGSQAWKALDEMNRLRDED